jgi:hypothetical protein
MRARWAWIRRPVILVPSSLVWKWHDDILCTLPDYRVLVIGSKRKRLTRGARKGLVTSETDTPEERAAKWVAFQSGQADVVILSFDALGRTKMSQEAVVEYINSGRGRAPLDQPAPPQPPGPKAPTSSASATGPCSSTASPPGSPRPCGSRRAISTTPASPGTTSASTC